MGIKGILPPKPKTMRHALLLLLLCMVASLGQAQTIRYNIDTDNPDFANFVIGFEPFYIDASKMNFPIGYGVTAHYYGKPIHLSLIYNRAGWLDFNKVLTASPPSLKRHNAWEIGVGLPFIDRKKNKPLRVVLSETTSGDYVTTKYIMVPGTLRRVTSLRGGLYHYRNSFNNEDFGDIVIDSVDFVASVHDYEPGVNQWEDFFGNVSVNALYAGLGISSISNLVISSPEGDFSGVRNRTLTSYVYIDAIFAPFVRISDFEHEPAPGDMFNLLPAGTYDLDDAYDKRRLGYRIGWMMNRSFQSSKGSRLGLFARMEAGNRPGLAGRNWYMLLTVGIGMNGKIGA